ncbi:MAG TPA: family 16 glycoside hydrolase [Verrucomicrobiae bacterium]
MEFDTVSVMSGAVVVLTDPFDRLRPEWQQSSGDWEVVGGVYRQTSSEMPALSKFRFFNHGTNYSIFTRARKIGGEEGFLVAFGMRDDKNYYWLNVGGWGNTLTRLEKCVRGNRAPFGPSINTRIQTDRWYDVRIEVTGKRIQCFINGQRIIDLTDDGFGD